MDLVEYFFQFRFCCKQIFSGNSCFFEFVYFFGASYIFRITSGQGELSQSERVGTERGCLSGWDQLICGCYRVKDPGAYFQKDVVCQRAHLRPVFDVRSINKVFLFITFLESVVNSLIIYSIIEGVFRYISPAVKSFCGCEDTTVCCSCCDGTCIHKCNG